MDTFVCVIGVSLVALCYVMFFALARKMLTKTEAAEEPGDEVLTIARDEGVTSAIAECVRQGEYDAAEKLAEVWGFNTTENLMNACNEMFDRETLKRMTVVNGYFRVRRGP